MASDEAKLASLESEEDRLMRHIEKKGRSGSSKFKKPVFSTASTTEPAQTNKPANQPARKWQQRNDTVDPEVQKRAAEMERQRDEEVRKQREHEAKILDQNRKTALNDYSIDRFLIKTEGDAGLNSAPPSHNTSYSHNSHNSHNSQKDDQETAKEEQRLLKKVNLPEKSYTPADIEEHRKKLEGSQSRNPRSVPVSQHEPIIGAQTVGIPPEFAIDQFAPINVHAAAVPPTPTVASNTTSAGCVLSQRLLAYRGLQVASFPSVNNLDAFLVGMSDLAIKLRETLVMPVNVTNVRASFNHTRFEDALLSFTNFILDNFSVTGNNTNGTVEAVNKLLQTSAEFLDSLEKASHSNDVDVARVNQDIYAVQKAVNGEAKSKHSENGRKQQSNLFVAKAIASIAEQSQLLAAHMVDYDPIKLDKCLQSIIAQAESTYPYLEDSAAILNRTHKVVEAAKIVKEREGEDPRDRSKVDQKLVRLISDLQTQRSH